MKSNYDIIWLDCVDSTNDEARRRISDLDNLSVLSALSQTQGRGQRGNLWLSEPGKNLLFSVVLKYSDGAGAPSLLPAVLGYDQFVISQLTSLAVVDLLASHGIETQIKWPNDIVVNGKKICGILTELCFHNGKGIVIIGTGINVNTDEFPEEIRDIAGSLKVETGKEISREALIASVLKYFEKFYEQYEKTEDFSLLKGQYECMMANYNQWVHVLDPQQPYDGVAKGITDAGSLIVVREDGTKSEVYSGEVSVRGLYGYV